jgi:hypothetical protein
MALRALKFGINIVFEDRDDPILLENGKVNECGLKNRL